MMFIMYIVERQKPRLAGAGWIEHRFQTDPDNLCTIAGNP
jgi:hypothetical protein